MNQLAIDFDAPIGHALRDAGIARALDHSGAGWADAVREFMERFLAARRDEWFAVEDFRVWALSNGMPAPRSHKAWGGVPRICKQLIYTDGCTRPATSPSTHAHRVLRYRAKA